MENKLSERENYQQVKDSPISLFNDLLIITYEISHRYTDI